MGRCLAAGLLAGLLAACSTGAGGGPAQAKPSSHRHLSESAAHPTSVRVPSIRPYVWVERAQRKLARVGIVGLAPHVQFPHYFVRTEPKAGTKVTWGSDVRLVIGDG